MQILDSAYRAVLRHAQATWPDECCGILLAEKPFFELICIAMPSRNVAERDRGHRYRLDYHVQLRALQLEQRGLAAVVGYYHSHPHGEPRLSPHDVQQAVEDVLYVVVAGGRLGRTVRAWKRSGASYREEPLERVETQPWAR